MSTNHWKNKGRKPILWLGFILGGLLVLLLSGFVYQTAVSRKDRSQYPPPGQLIDVDGHAMHLYYLGEGSPTVVLESGLGEALLTWNKVQAETAVFTRVCSYDRVGLGWSQPVGGPVLSAQVADNLHTLLQKAGESGPYVLVGHSIGGIHVRSFAHQYPNDVVGVVLVDSSHERQLAENLDEVKVPMLMICNAIAPFGLTRAINLFETESNFNPHLTSEQRQMLLALLNKSHHCQTVANEMTATETDLRQPHLNSLRDLPLTVLTATQNISRHLDEHPGQPIPQVYSQWTAYQLELVALSTNGMQILAAESGHLIPYDEPALVVAAIKQMVPLANTGK